jgi:hypothetical protein
MTSEASDEPPAAMAADGHVTFDPVSRSVFVKPAKHAGYAGLLWRRGHQAMMEDAGRYGAPAVWAHFTGCREIARCVPERDGWCRFQSRHNDPVYRQLSQMGHLAAVVTVDRQAPRVSPRIQVYLHNTSNLPMEIVQIGVVPGSLLGRGALAQPLTSAMN